MDENFNGRIFRGLLRTCPELDAVRVQDTEVQGADDPAVLEWAGKSGRIVVSHDVNTMSGFAYERVIEGKPMPGLILVPEDMPTGAAIEELRILAEAVKAEEFEGKVEYLPM